MTVTMPTNQPTFKDAQRDWYARNPLRIWRKRQHPMLSMMDVATAFGVGMSAVQSWEQGAHQPNDESIEKLAAGMGVKPATLARKWRSWYKSRPTI